jgi:hypothetical protein
MTGSLGPDDGRRDGDALDRAIDNALGAELRGGPGNLRARVLARIEESLEDGPSRWPALFRPALLPAAGAALIVLAVAATWWQVDDQLGRAGTGRGRASAGGVGQPQASGTLARQGPALPVAPVPTGEAPTSASPAASGKPQAVSRDGRVFATSWLGMDRLSRPKGIAADTVIAGEDEPESFLPGAVGGDLGDPIRPIPRPKPIEIPPIVTAPIVDAPPVSTLATPVSTLSEDSRSRDQTGPGKSGGVRP